MNRRDFLVQSALSAAALSSLGRPPAATAAEPRSIFEQVRAGRPLEGVDAIDAHAHFDVISGDLIWPLGVDMLYRARNKYPWYEMQTLYPFDEDGISRAVKDAIAMKTVKSTIVPWPELM